MLPSHAEQHSNVVSAAQYKQVAENWQLRAFEPLKALDGCTSLYKIDYFKEKLNCLESLDEGEITFSGRIRFQRFYLQSTVYPNATYKDFITKVTDVTCSEKRATFVAIHGFASSSDIFFETALQLCPNGYDMVMVDLEGHGYSSGPRCANLNIERFSHQVASALSQADPSLPCFLCGHSLGGLVVNTFLGNNPEIAKRLAGVIYLAPLFQMAKHAQKNIFEVALMNGISCVMEEMVFNSSMPTHRISQNRTSIRNFLTQSKSSPLVSAGMFASVVRNIDRVDTYADRVDYPYLLLLGDKDIVVSNEGAQKWHSKTSSKVKQLRLLANTFHDLTKEPNNHKVFESILRFLSLRTQSKEIPVFGQLNLRTDINFGKIVPFWKKRKFWTLCAVFYLLIGLVIVVMRKQYKHFLSWPALLVFAKRMR